MTLYWIFLNTWQKTLKLFNKLALLSKNNFTMEKYYIAAENAFAEFYRGIPAPIDKDKEHVCDIAASVMMTRDNVLLGGSFVQAVVDNNLEKAVNRADSICIRNLVFFVYCKNFVHLEN